MKYSLFALALAAALPLSAHAAGHELSYTWAEIDYNDFDHGTDGWGLRGSFNFGDSGFYAFGSYSWLNADSLLDDRSLGGDLIHINPLIVNPDLSNLPNVNVDYNELGVGYHWQVAENTDLIGEVAYRNANVGGVDLNVDLDGDGILDIDDARDLNIDGARFSFGVNAALSPCWEGFIKANYYDFSDYSGDFTGTVGAQWKWSERWGAVAEAEFGNGNQAYTLGVRASF